CGGQAFDEEVTLGTDRVLGGKFHILHKATGVGNAVANRGKHLCPGQPQLSLAVDRAGAEEDVNALPSRRRQCLCRRRDVHTCGAGERADGRSLELARDGLDRPGITKGGGGETCLDHVDSERGQRSGEAQLFVLVHREAGRLLAVAQGRVENPYLLGHAAFVLNEALSWVTRVTPWRRPIWRTRM